MANWIVCVFHWPLLCLYIGKKKIKIYMIKLWKFLFQVMGVYLSVEGVDLWKIETSFRNFECQSWWEHCQNISSMVGLLLVFITHHSCRWTNHERYHATWYSLSLSPTHTYNTHAYSVNLFFTLFNNSTQKLHKISSKIFFIIHDSDNSVISKIVEICVPPSLS